MSFAIDNEVKDRVRLAINIVDLISSYVELRRQGRGFVALCPFHDDRRPSMQVNPERQTWKCWVCDNGGDAFSFVMKKEGLSFPEALRMLAERAGIQIEPPNPRSGRVSGDDKKLLLEAMQWAVGEFHACLLNAPEAENAREYLGERGISAASIAKFRLGYAPDSWSWLADRGLSKNWKADVLESVGLLARGDSGSRYDRFRGRAMFPINDAQGRPIAVGGRILPGAAKDSAKYINCSETRLYHKSRELYGLDLAKDAIRKTRQAVVMEGYTDVIMAVQHGIDNAVACCGTALGESHIKVLKHTCDSVVLLLDGDEAGQRRTAEILELFVTAQMDLRILTLPDDLDPCDYLLKYSGEELKGLIGGAVDALEHKLRQVCRGFDPLLDTHRANTALEDVLQTMSHVSHKSLLSNESSRLRQDQLIARLARQFGIEQAEIRLRLDSIRKQAAARDRQRQQFRAEQSASGANAQAANSHSTSAASHPTGALDNKQTDAPKYSGFKFSEMSATECELFEIMTLHPELAPVAIERFPVASLNTETAKGLFQAFLDLELAGHALDFGSLMSAMEDPSLKSVLVSIEEHSARKAPLSSLTADERLHSLCERLNGNEDKSHRRKQIQSLEKKQFDDETELNVLQDIVQQARVRHGLFPPTH
ncbi:MAG: DNA primase [Pirellula sp.]